jgi:succinate dehydrogenase / fumarate reductase, cytochrome b subunit
MKTPETERKGLPNNLGITGWVYAGSYRLERYLYTLHRVTGLGVLVYLLMHIGVTWFKNDPVMWTFIMGFLEHPFFKVGEYMVYFGVVFHGLNGIRLIIGEFGYMLGSPRLPVYPYPLALLRQRPLLAVLMVITGIIVILGAVNIFILTH